MAKRLGYGGIANTNGARDFSGKEAFAGSGALPRRMLMGVGTCWQAIAVLSLAALLGFT